ncbi:hypothetical protein [Ligilactobacillus agilis]|uniref:hypothetical protein n=1 Tax=Ligilactobacillus agilis TaxID=1601 RepID=UPI003D803DCC
MLVKDWVQDRVDYAVEDTREEIAQKLIEKAIATEQDYDSLRADLIDFFDVDFADKMLTKYYK